MGKAFKFETRKSDPLVAKYFEVHDEDGGIHGAAIRTWAKKKYPELKEGIYWGVPFLVRHGPIAYLSAAKTHLTLGFVRGVEIADQFGKLTGTGKSPIRKCTIKVKQEIDWIVVESWFAEAMRLDEENKLDFC